MNEKNEKQEFDIDLKDSSSEKEKVQKSIKSEQDLNLDESLNDQEISGSEDEGILEEDISEELISEEDLAEKEKEDFKKNLIEAALYVAGTSLTIEEISTKLDFTKKEVEEIIKQLAFDYLDRSTALIISQLGEDTYQMQIKPEYMDYISKFAKGGAISEKYLRTLTIIALKQPILKSTLVKLRGSGAYEHVSYLLENGLISATKKGRTSELITTEKYAEMFGLPKNVEEMKKIMITQLGIEEKQDNKEKEQSE